MADVMAQVETVVMLMLENRSFDTMLGWLYQDLAEPTQHRSPAHVYPPGSNPDINGIPRDAVNFGESWPFSPEPGTQHLAEPFRTPRWDPHEGIANVKDQMYADGYGIKTDDNWGHAAMTGFAWDFPDRGVAGEVMGAYSKDQLPVLYGLAEGFAASDRWFSSVPTMTDPNRAFSICGTSSGRTSDIPEHRYDIPTIFGALSGETAASRPSKQNAKKSWGIYWQSREFVLHPGLEDRPCETANRFPQIMELVENGLGCVAPYKRLLDALHCGDDIPEFCYIEPYWGAGVDIDGGADFIGVQGNDYHPPTWVGPAEAALSELYTALTNSRQWAKMLFIVVFDEHGGTWDHEPPTVTVAPDVHTAESGFDFTRLGPRVPMILVSPFVQPETVFRAPPTPNVIENSHLDFDHTSTLATLLKWAGIDPANSLLGKRVAVAPTFEGVLTAEPSGVQPPEIVVPAGYAKQGGGVGLHLFDNDWLDVAVHELRISAAAADSAEQFIERLFEISQQSSPRGD